MGRNGVPDFAALHPGYALGTEASESNLLQGYIKLTTPHRIFHQ